MIRFKIWMFVTTCVFAAAVALHYLPAPIKPDRGLPHRQEWELYKQANSPAAGNCPEGTAAMYVAVDDKEFFLECFSQRGTTNAISQ